MKFINMCNTEQLKDYINKIFTTLKNRYPEAKLDVCFTQNSNMSSEGLYVFADSDNYHYVYSERGHETTHKKTKDLFEISYWVFQSITIELAFDYASSIKAKDSEYRKIAFSKQLEMLTFLGEEYKKRGEEEINKIYKLHS